MDVLGESGVFHGLFICTVLKTGEEAFMPAGNLERLPNQPIRQLGSCPAIAWVTAEPESDMDHPDGHALYFNRGCAGSQAYARQFGDKLPRDPRAKGEPTPWAWLSRGLEEGLLEFIGRATSGGAGWGLRLLFRTYVHGQVSVAWGGNVLHSVGVTTLRTPADHEFAHVHARLERQRLVNRVLGDLPGQRIHALSVKALAPGESA